MALLSESQLRNLSRTQRSQARDSADALSKSLMKASSLSSFDIFLSHSHLDRELIDGAIRFLDGLGYSVYVDSQIDPAPENITKSAAEQVRKRLAQSKALFFATTDGAKHSRWMPWELGYMDGRNGKCAILPITSHESDGNSYDGREDLGVYPYVTSSRNTEGKRRIWIRENSQTYVSFKGWIGGTAPYVHD